MPSFKDTVLPLKDWKKYSCKNKCLALLLCIINILQWCIVLGCLTGLVVQGVKCVEKYLKRDTKVIQTIIPSKNATFPGFTECPSYEDAYKLQVLQSYGTSKEIYKGGKQYFSISLNYLTLYVLKNISSSSQR